MVRQLWPNKQGTGIVYSIHVCLHVRTYMHVCMSACNIHHDDNSNNNTFNNLNKMSVLIC